MSSSHPNDAPIVLRGCRQHVLRGFDLELPRGTLIAVTGVSGSGKSSLAFDTLFAEGQRRYVESFSAHARQFLERMDRPALDGLDGIPPAVAIEQGNAVRSSRSTVGTITEIHDYLKVLFARAGVRHCDRCGEPVRRLTPGAIADALLQAHPPGDRLILGFDLAPVTEQEWGGLRAELRRQGFQRLLVDGRVERLDALASVPSTGAVVVLDRLKAAPRRRSRLVDSLEQALAHGRGRVRVARIDADGLAVGGARAFDTELRCDACGLAHADPSPAQFTFNNPVGACPTCRGFGRTIEIDPDLVVPDPSLSLEQGAIKPWTTPKTRRDRREMLRLCRLRGIPTDRPYSRLGRKHRSWLWKGEPGGWDAGAWWGIDRWFQWLETRAYKLHVRVLLSRYRTYVPCRACGGTRFRPESLRTELAGLDIAELSALPVAACRSFFDDLELPAHLESATAPLLGEVRARLRYLAEVGLDYLTLDRQSRTLSGGEMQRVDLTTAVGSSLTGTLFVLDEPSVGLHPRDNRRLAALLRRLVDQGNTAVVVEHDEALIRAADHLVDLGPGAGEAGGRLLYQGPVAGAERVGESVTGQYLSGRLRVPVPEKRRPPAEGWIVVKGARAHCLRGIDARFPVGRFTCVTGVSGAGKSSLVDDVLRRGLLRARGRPVESPGAHDGIDGGELVADVAFVDATPIGRSPKSTVGTYLKAHDRLRRRLASTPEAREAGLAASALSFNRPGGRCETCEGAGFERVEMQFLADVNVPCADCGGARFRPDVLSVRIGGRDVAELLQLTLDEAAEIFADDGALVRRLRPARAVGLGYLRLGQPVVTLSGGEAQRLKLATAMATRSRGVAVGRGDLFLFDEPSTGLAAADLPPLLRAFELLVDAGHTLVVIEHAIEVIRCADWVLDLGPEAGARGGRLVAAGPPEAIAACAESITGRYLGACLGSRRGTDTAGSGAGAGRPTGRRRREREAIHVHGAHEHLLQHVDVDLPRGQLIVVTGPSGSGKSSLAFDVLFAEGQRRYLETLSPYARQFLAPLARPAVDRIDGLPPAIAIEQRRTRGGPKSTVATLTEAWHYLRLAWARLGRPHCPGCDEPLERGTVAQVARAISRRFAGRRVRLLAPVVRGRKGLHRELFEKLAADGIARARVDGRTVRTHPTPALERHAPHDVDAEVTVTVAPSRPGAAFTSLVEAALARGGGTVTAASGRDEAAFSTVLRCPRCGTGVPEPEPPSFSFQGPRGACPACDGRGARADFDERALVPNPSLSLRGGALPVLRGAPFSRRATERFARQAEEHLGVDGDRPWSALGRRQRRRILEGAAGFTGLEQRLRDALEDGTAGAGVRRFLVMLPCGECGGSRLRAESRAVRLEGRRLPDVAALGVAETRAWIEGLRPRGARRAAILEPIRRELVPKLRFLEQVGLGYLSLDRAGDTLSGGETQRLRLAASLGSHLTGVLYVLDEPTIGLHPVDGKRLIETLKELRDAGNTVVVVEHDEEVIRSADWIVDMGPGAGGDGGRIVAEGPPDRLARNAASSTARALRGEGRGRRNRRSAPAGPWLTVTGASEHDLRDVDLAVPLRAFTCVTGVSGSGKSTLVRDVLLKAVQARLGTAAVRPGAHRGLSGVEEIERAAEVDQSPIGRNPRSTPATYVGLWTDVRELFAATPEARARGYGPSRFSHNVAGGRCEKCEGQGVLAMEMSFLPDARVPCDACSGRRYNAETLQVRWRGRTVADVLETTMEEAAALFGAHPAIRAPLDLARRVGLGYLQLGQPSPTLSGGEAQRIKLVEELGRPGTRPTLFVLDEPTTGLSIADVSSLVDVLHALVERGDTVVAIEHHLDVIAEADWVVDLGPGGGAAGGRIVAEGPPERLRCRRGQRSATRRALRDWLAERR